MPVILEDINAREARLGRSDYFVLPIALDPRGGGEGLFSQFTDPTDGRLDASEFVLKKRGFLPFPLIITEPAVNYGGRFGAVFFHESEEDAWRRQQAIAPGSEDMAILPPSVTAVLGAVTENGS